MEILNQSEDAVQGHKDVAVSSISGRRDGADWNHPFPQKDFKPRRIAGTKQYSLEVTAQNAPVQICVRKPKG